MKGMIWNSDGFGDTGKHFTVKEAIREQSLDFVAIIETGRGDFASPFLDHLAGGFNFVWYVLPPHGRSGGILVGFNEAVFTVQDVISGDFCIKFRLKNKSDGFLWSLVIVYGAAQEESKHLFLAEMVRICDNEPLPMLVGGGGFKY